MVVTPGFTYLAYFQNKFKKKYYIIGEVTQIWSAIYPEAKNKLDVCLFLIKAYAGTREYFRKQSIPLTHKEFKKKFPRKPYLIFTNTPLDLKNQSDYVRTRVRKDKEAFLFHVRCALSAWEKVGNDIVFNPTDIYYALLPLVHKGTKPNTFEELDPSSNYTAKISEYIRSRLWCDLAKEGNEIVVTYKAYQAYLHGIAETIYDFYTKEGFTEDDITRLNRNKPPRDNPINEFIYSFLYEFKESLRLKKRLGICPVCGAAFQYKDIKIYCSPKCLKSRENATHYNKYKSVLLPNKLQVTKEIRECYRDHGLRK